MVTSQRASARFFAAFYRWNHCTARQACLTNNSPIRKPKPLLAAASRSYSTASATSTPSEPCAADHELPATPILTSESLLPHTPTHVHTTSSTPDALRNSVRTLMRNVPHPVVVLTAASPSTSPPSPLGLAISSFNTVTLDPPTISFNIRHPSRTLSAIRDDDGKFRIHFLSPRPMSAEIAAAFTNGNHEGAFEVRRRLVRLDMNAGVVGRAEGKEGGFTSRAARILDPHVTASMSCVVEKEVEVGDHVIVVAKVSDVMREQELKEPFLMYVNGEYVLEG